MIQAAQAVGGATRRDLSATVAQLAEDEALLPPLERQLAAARHQVALLVGRAPAADRARDLDLRALTLPSRAPLRLPAELVRARPDILAAEADLHAATAALGIARANQFPNVRLSADFTQTALSPGDLFASSASGWNVSPGLTAPLFDGGRLKAGRQAAEADLRTAEAPYQQTVLRAFVHSYRYQMCSRRWRVTRRGLRAWGGPSRLENRACGTRRQLSGSAAVRRST